MNPAANTHREIYCRSYCESFQPLSTGDGTLLCGRCHSILVRRNPQGFVFCEENCGEYRDVFEEPLHNGGID